MAPSPEYDKEPKAPDKSATNISSEDSKLLQNLVNDQHHSSDHKTTNTATNSEVENNKHVETLDDEKLRALLNEALTYKCPKDREGKSSLFKELLEEVEQDDQESCEAAARSMTGCRGSRRGARGAGGGGGRPALPHSNSLQDLVAALAAEPMARRHRHHAAPAPAHHASTVAARALHGGSLPSGVDTSSMLSEEGGAAGGGRAGAGYLATVRCVNPPPLNERRVSASDANAPIDLELLNRRSKPMFPMTYTARASLEISSSSVCSGRAVTTTTASNQEGDAGGGCVEAAPRGKAPRGPRPGSPPPAPLKDQPGSQVFEHNVGVWYDGLAAYSQRSLVHGAPPPPLPPPLTAPKPCSHVAGVAGKHVRSRRPLGQCYDALTPEECVATPQSPIDCTSLKEQYSEIYKKESLYTDFKDSNQWHYNENAYRVVERLNNCDSETSDFRLRKTYRKGIVPTAIPNLPPINPRNIRNMSIGKPKSSFDNVDSWTTSEGVRQNKIDQIQTKSSTMTAGDVTPDPTIESSAMEVLCTDIKANDTRIAVESSDSMEDQTSKCFQMSDVSSRPAERAPGATDANAPDLFTDNNDIELEEIVCHRATKHNRDTGSFSNYLADQENLFRVLQATDSNALEDEYGYTVNVLENNNNEPSKRSHDTDTEPTRESGRDVSSDTDMSMSSTDEREKDRTQDELAVRATRPPEERAPSDRYILAELPNNAYVFLTLPKRLLTPLSRARRADLAELEDMCALPAPAHPTDKPKKKKDKPSVGTSSYAKRKEMIDKNALRALLFENLLKSDRWSSTRAPAGADTEVDSAIPFSCITTPEVVASCNTTSSAAHAATATATAAAAAAAILPADSKPLGEAEGAATPAAAPAPPPPAACPDPPDEQPRAGTAAACSGLPLARPGCGAAPSTSGDDYKVPTHTIVPLLPSFVKSLDENGNSVQGYGSPLSGSSQHKKPRRKKSSKNETVIDCRQIDGYQGHKDVNELLRFIESESERAPKLRKHKDDSDDKSKKRSADRRKHHEHKPARASSLEELSRTTIEELTARAPPAKPERRSWGDAAPPPLAPDPPPPAEQADFQTVTKKRKPRRRTEEAVPRRARAPSPRPADSAPPSDRSNDSNDDMDSVHSLPERAPPATTGAPPAPHASYADIARTRNNIPDLIESCNFYAEDAGEHGCGLRRAEPPPARPPDPPPGADGYPALDERTEPLPAAPTPRRAPRDKPSPPPARRKERPPPATAHDPPAECPAPDVVSDRRPPVILLDTASQPRDMDGVTFGFDINEQLLVSGARRPRCDLVRDAVEAAPDPAVAAPPALGAVPVAVRAAKRALRYVPPPPPTDHTQLHQIVDFVGAAWEDVVRCGGGKVRYFSE